MSKHATPDSKEGRSTSSVEPAHPEPVRTEASRTAASFSTSAMDARASWTPSQFLPHDLSRARSHKDEPARTSANESNKQHSVREYTLGEEIANSVTHGIGALLSIVAIILCVVKAMGDGGGIILLCALVYSIAQLLEYLMSTLYHAIAVESAKRVFKILDHSFIYIYIAACYTPFCLIALADSGGIALCVFVWVVTVVGVVFEAFWVFRPRWVSAVLYLLLGWCVIWFIGPLVAWLPASGLYLLVASGLCFTVGCVFYVMKKVPYMHSVFHLWVLAGSICMFLAIFTCVL